MRPARMALTAAGLLLFSATASVAQDAVNFADVQIPAKPLEIQVSNFNYNKNN